MEYGCERVEVVDGPAGDLLRVGGIGIDTDDHLRVPGIAIRPRGRVVRDRPAAPSTG